MNLYWTSLSAHNCCVAEKKIYMEMPWFVSLIAAINHTVSEMFSHAFLDSCDCTLCIKELEPARSQIRSHIRIKKGELVIKLNVRRSIYRWINYYLSLPNFLSLCSQVTSYAMRGTEKREPAIQWEAWKLFVYWMWILSRGSLSMTMMQPFW